MREADSKFESTLAFLYPAAWVDNHLYSPKYFMFWWENTAEVSFMWWHKGLFSRDVRLWHRWDYCQRNLSSTSCFG